MTLQELLQEENDSDRNIVANSLQEFDETKQSKREKNVEKSRLLQEGSEDDNFGALLFCCRSVTK